jgi:tetratricopeptide (TPR) repeat protein
MINFLADISIGEKIALWGVIVTASAVLIPIVLHLLLKKKSDTVEKKQGVGAKRDDRHDALIEHNHNIAAVAYLRGDIDVAQAATDEVLRLEPNNVISLSQRGQICRLQGKLDEAEKAYLRVQELGVEVNNEQWQAAASGNLGLIYETRGQLDKAEEMYKKSLEISEKLGRPESIANAYGNLGSVYEQRGDKKKEREYWERALAIFKKIGMQPEVKKVQGWIDGLGK